MNFVEPFFVYVFKDPSRFNEPIYVGKGKNKRHQDHFKRKDRHPFVHRLAKMKRENVEPLIEFIATGLDEEMAHLVEIEAIDKWGRKDLGKGTLLNLTNGGDGASGYKHTLEARRKRSAAQLGHPVSAETRQKLSALAKVRPPVSAETRQKLSNLAKTCSAETRQKLSEASKRRKFTPEVRQRISEAATARHLKARLLRSENGVH